MGLLDSIISSIEKVGFKAANFTHRTVVTALFVGSSYGFYTILRDYRAYFKMRKDPRYKEYIDQREQAIREIMTKKDE